jgi:uncharacterized protein (TIGR03790 family)
MLLLASLQALAGGGPLNVLVLYNGDIAESAELALHYAALRSVPDQHLCALHGLEEEKTQVSWEEYSEHIHAPFLDCMDALDAADAIDFLVLVRGLPYEVLPSSGSTSLSAMLQVSMSDLAGEGAEMPSVYNPHFINGHPQAGDYTLANPYSGPYVASTTIVRSVSQPSFQRVGDEVVSGLWDLTDSLFIVTRLDGFDYADAAAAVDSAVSSDESFPTDPFLCMASSDTARGARDPECEFAIRQLDAIGFPAMWLPDFDAELSGYGVSAYFTGSAELTGAIDGLDYAPGAIACNLTSYGARSENFFCDASGEVCPETEVQTSVARFVRAGASGVHGTVEEPYNNCFPNAGTMLLYALGYGLGESFFFNQPYLYWRNMVIGDPLAAPYAERPEVGIEGGEAIPMGSTAVFSASHSRGISGMALYSDGVLLAEVEGGQLEWAPSGGIGDELDLLLVATARDGYVQVPGWPSGETWIAPKTKGWSELHVEISAPLVKEDPKERPGSCQSLPPLFEAGVFSLAMMSLVLRRRERKRMPL